MAIPRPGEPVRGSDSGSPMNALFDLLGRRWALGIMWNLGQGPASFRELQQRCGNISPSILNSRIKDLREADVLERGPQGYQLTARGHQLRTAVIPLGTWAATWSAEVFHYQKPGMQTALEAEQPKNQAQP